MCGIAGIFHFDPSREVDGVKLRKMTACISHRGPDGEGFYIRDNIGLGHRRLSIIDLSTGDQPIFNEDKTISIIFNGEIYNYIELREELKAIGHSFRTNSDTEVIMRAYEQWGVDCQNKLNGMWAFALWDDRKQQLFLSRDRIGEKPLIYSIYDNSLLFGSEIKSVLAYGVPATPNLELTELYFTLGYIPAPYTFYKNINKLPAGYYLVVSKDKVEKKQYWDLPEIDEDNMISDKKEVYEKFEYLLRDSVRIRMRSDVPFGAFLSGGLDSSSIVALMSEISNQPVKTFTIGFKEKMFDERELALKVAEQYKTEHYVNMIEPDDFDDALNKIMYQFDEPFGDSSAMPTGYVSKVAAQKVKMVLTGDGGDEVLSGYNANQLEKFSSRYSMVPRMFRNILPGMVNGIGSMVGGDIGYKFKRVGKGLDLANQSYQVRLVSKLCRPELAERLIANGEKQVKVRDFISDFDLRYKMKNSFYKLIYFQLKLLLPDDFLTKVDRMSMAHSLETRIPFLDYRLVEYMIKVKSNIKMEGYERKSILVNTLGKRLPLALLNAPKRGFSVPLRDWFKDKSFEQKFQSLYSSDSGLNNKIIRQLVEENNSGKEDRGNLIWMLFVFKKWLNKDSLK